MSAGPGIAEIRRLLAAFEAGGAEALAALVDNDFRFEVPADLSAEPDEYRGPDGIRRYFAGFEGLMEQVGLEVLEFIPAGDECLITPFVLSARGARSGLPVEQPTYGVWWLRSGRPVRLELFRDIGSARAAASAGPPDD